MMQIAFRYRSAVQGAEQITFVIRKFLTLCLMRSFSGKSINLKICACQ